MQLKRYFEIIQGERIIVTRAPWDGTVSRKRSVIHGHAPSNG